MTCVPTGPYLCPTMAADVHSQFMASVCAKHDMGFYAPNAGIIHQASADASCLTNALTSSDCPGELW